MSFRLPAQQPIEGTYMTNPTVEWLIKNRLGSNQLEDETTGLWNSILHEVYPSISGFFTRAEKKDKSGDFVYLYTAHVAFEKPAKVSTFLIIECKTSGLETQDKVWEDAKEQLENYLRDFAEEEFGKRMFGAIAIGKVVRFYEWDGPQNSVKNLANELLYLDRQCQTVTGWLHFIRDNHE